MQLQRLPQVPQPQLSVHSVLLSLFQTESQTQTDPGGPIPSKFGVLFRLGVKVPDLLIFMLCPKQGFSLRSDERFTAPPLMARRPVRNARAMKGIYFLLSSTKPIEKMKEEKQP
jgi:hypothetical protein